MCGRKHSDGNVQVCCLANRFVLINDALSHQLAASVLSPTRAKIVCLHIPDMAQGGLDVVDVNEGE